MLADIVGYNQLARPGAGSLEHGFEFRHAIATGVLELGIRVVVGGIGGYAQGIGTVDESGTQRQGRGIPDAKMKNVGGGKNAIPRRGVGDGVAHYLADLDAAYLMQEEHIVSEWRGSLLVEDVEEGKNDDLKILMTSI